MNRSLTAWPIADPPRRTARADAPSPTRGAGIRKLVATERPVNSLGSMFSERIKVSTIDSAAHTFRTEWHSVLLWLRLRLRHATGH